MAAAFRFGLHRPAPPRICKGVNRMSPRSEDGSVLQLRKGRYLARPATAPDDLARAQSLRALCFGRPAGAADADPFDQLCTQIMIEEDGSGTLVGCFRLLAVPDGAAVQRSYSAQFYDLAGLARFPGPMAEIGRFCIHPAHLNPDILRIAWGALTAWVDATGVRLLFGCTSFAGDQAAPHLDAFSLLHRKHIAPTQWRPGIKAPEVFEFASGLAGHVCDPAKAQAGLPPLLRSYLVMGGWVSDHAVFDHEMQTMHVFTGVEVDAIPPTRARLLRAVSG